MHACPRLVKQKYASIYIYIYTCIHTYVYIYIYIYMYVFHEVIDCDSFSCFCQFLSDVRSVLKMSLFKDSINEATGSCIKWIGSIITVEFFG